MRRLRIALAACALFAAPVALGAQQPAPPIVKPIPPGHPGMPVQPGHRPQPRPSGYNPNQYRNNGNRYTPYVYIDASPYLATPKPKPKPTPAAHHQNDNGYEVFSTYSTNNAK